MRQSARTFAKSLKAILIGRPSTQKRGAEAPAAKPEQTSPRQSSVVYLLAKR